MNEGVVDVCPFDVGDERLVECVGDSEFRGVVGNVDVECMRVSEFKGEVCNADVVCLSVVSLSSSELVLVTNSVFVA